MFNPIDATKSRINSLNNSVSALAETANDEALKHATKAVEQSSHVQDLFTDAVHSALAAIREYLGMTIMSFSDGYRHAAEGAEALEHALSTGNPVDALPHVAEAMGHSVATLLNLHLGKSLAINVKEAFAAGTKVLAGNVTVTTLAQIAMPVAVIIAIGYASLRIKHMTISKTREMATDVFESDDSDDDDEETDHEDAESNVLIDALTDESLDESDVVVAEQQEDESPEAAISRVQNKAEDAIEGGA
jgi:hypothetical protein